MSEHTTHGEDVGLVERAFYIGLGATMLARDKVEELADELVQRGKMTQEQSDTFVNRLVDQADETGKSVRSAIQKETERTIESLGLATSKDIEGVRAELTEIKALIASLRSVVSMPNLP